MSDIQFKITDSLGKIFAAPLLVGGFPLNKKYIEKKKVIKYYLKFHLFQNKILQKFFSNETDSDFQGVVIGHLGKLSQNKQEAGDYSNLFLKSYLNRNGIKTAELLIPNLRELFLFKKLTNKKLLRKNFCFPLFYKDPKGDKIGKSELRSILEEEIKNVKGYLNSDSYIKKISNISFVEENLEETLSFISSKQFENYFFGMALGIADFLKKTEPDFLIINSITNIKERIALFVAKQYGVSVIFVPHGLSKIKYRRVGGLSEDILISRSYNKEIKKEETEGRQIWNLGPLNFGYLIADNKTSSEKKTIMYATQPLSRDRLLSEEKYRDFLLKLFSTFKDIKDESGVSLIIKPHPRDNPHLYKKIAKKVKLKAHFIEKPSPVSLNKIKREGLKVAVSGFSGIGLEMIISGIPLLGIVPSRSKGKIFDYKNYGVPVYTEKNLNQFKEMIFSILNDSEKEREALKKEQAEMKKKEVWLEKNSLDSFVKFLKEEFSK